MLSLSFWRDEEAVKAWRNTEEHRQAQQAGRGGIFAGYRLRIAHVRARLWHGPSAPRRRRTAGR